VNTTPEVGRQQRCDSFDRWERSQKSASPRLVRPASFDKAAKIGTAVSLTVAAAGLAVIGVASATSAVAGAALGGSIGAVAGALSEVVVDAFGGLVNHESKTDWKSSAAQYAVAGAAIGASAGGGAVLALLAAGSPSFTAGALTVGAASAILGKLTTEVLRS
jgi:hypothetical protein